MAKKKNRNLILREDNIEVGEISVEEAREKSRKEFNPCESFDNIYIEERQEFERQVLNPCQIGFNLKQFIDFLIKIHETFGDMPVLYFNGSTQCFTKPTLNDIDIVKKYFTVTANAERRCMNIYNSKALSLFHI